MSISKCNGTVWVAGVVALACLAAGRAGAHPVSLSEARVDIRKDGIEATLSIMLEDLYLYHDIAPDETYYFKPAVLRETAEAHGALLTEWFRIQDLAGDWLPLEVTGMRLPEMEEEGVHVADLMKYFVEYTLACSLDTAPAYLTLVQTFGGADAMMPASMQVSLTREGEKMGYSYVLPRDVPSAIRIDWSRPPLSPDASAEEQEAWLEQENEAVLGIASYGAAYSFLYINDREVRHEVLIPLLSLESWEPLDRADPRYIDVAEQQAARDTVAALLKAHSTVTIDGVEVTPNLDRLDFYGLDFKDFAQQAPKKRLSAYTARVGAILSYSCKGAPGEVAVEWRMFNANMPALYTTVFPYDEAERFAFAEYADTFEWKNPGRPPLPEITSIDAESGLPIHLHVATLVLGLLAFGVLFVRRLCPHRRMVVAAVLALVAAACWPFGAVPVAAGAPGPENSVEARAIFSALHANIYRAFDYGDESDIYDALARSVSGDLLKDLYLQVHAGLRMQEQGGAIARVEAVTLLDGTAQLPERGWFGGTPGFAYACTWQVKGTVEHWGHIHGRTNQYRAAFQVSPVEGAWKITGLEVLDEERVRFETSVRRARRDGP